MSTPPEQSPKDASAPAERPAFRNPCPAHDIDTYIGCPTCPRQIAATERPATTNVLLKLQGFIEEARSTHRASERADLLDQTSDIIHEALAAAERPAQDESGGVPSWLRLVATSPGRVYQPADLLLSALNMPHCCDPLAAWLRWHDDLRTALRIPLAAAERPSDDPVVWKRAAHYWQREYNRIAKKHGEHVTPESSNADIILAAAERPQDAPRNGDSNGG